MFTRTRVSFSVLLVMLASLLAIAAPASAHRTPTRVIISSSSPFFHGAVRSKKGACKYGRTLKLYREDDQADELVLSTTSDGNGEWTMMIGENSGFGFYYALAPPTRGCKSGKSAAVEN